MELPKESLMDKMATRHHNNDIFPLTNRAGESSSPYVRAHKDNPVAWQLWNQDTIALAKRHERMIFLSIGYSACHWCHVMEHESFESPDVASLLNDKFIPIKVDREAQQDIDEIYMQYVTATTGSGGWPLNVFLTPNLEPIFGGTYWPGSNASSHLRRNSIGEVSMTFLDILEKMRDVWYTQRQRCLQSAKEITQQLRHFSEEGTHSRETVSGESSPEPLDLDLLDDAFAHFETRYDSLYGGFTSSATSPKFPTHPNLLFLLRLGGGPSSRSGFPAPVPSILGSKSASTALRMAAHTLVAMSRGGIRDQLGAGFSRYSVTRDWKLPHFEKMLTDNAQLLSVYSMAFSATGDLELLGAIHSLTAYLTSSSSPIISAGGGFYSSEDADSFPSNACHEKHEGAYYVFTHKEIHTILAGLPLPKISDRNPAPQYPTTPPNPAEILCRHFGVQPDGNIDAQYDPHDEFLGQNVLSIAATPSVLAKEFGLSEAGVVRILKAGKERLHEWRVKNRPRPGVDTKVVTGWQGLAISGLLDASEALEHADPERSQECLESAVRIAEFVKDKMCEESSGKLFRVWTPDMGLDGGVDAFADDYAYTIRAAIGLYEAGAGERFLEWADKLTRLLLPSDAPISRQLTEIGVEYLLTHYLDAHSSGFYTVSSASPSAVHNILRLKSGTDNSLPSPNGIIASNLLRLSVLLNEPNYAKIAAKTIDAFAVEVIQHPFLFVSMLDAVVWREVGGNSVTVPGGLRVKKRWERCVLTLEDGGGAGRGNSEWLRNRNAVFGAANGGRLSAEGKVLLCGRNGICREVTLKELEDHDGKADEE